MTHSTCSCLCLKCPSRGKVHLVSQPYTQTPAAVYSVCAVPTTIRIWPFLKIFISYQYFWFADYSRTIWMFGCKGNQFNTCIDYIKKCVYCPATFMLWPFTLISHLILVYDNRTIEGCVCKENQNYTLMDPIGVSVMSNNLHSFTFFSSWPQILSLLTTVWP